MFSGRYSTQIGEGAHQRLRRSGFAGISSNPPEEGPMDLEDYDALVFRWVLPYAIGQSRERMCRLAKRVVRC